MNRLKKTLLSLLALAVFISICTNGPSTPPASIATSTQPITPTCSDIVAELNEELERLYLEKHTQYLSFSFEPKSIQPLDLDEIEISQSIRRLTEWGINEGCFDNVDPTVVYIEAARLTPQESELVAEVLRLVGGFTPVDYVLDALDLLLAMANGRDLLGHPMNDVDKSLTVLSLVFSIIIDVRDINNSSKFYKVLREGYIFGSNGCIYYTNERGEVMRYFVRLNKKEIVDINSVYEIFRKSIEGKDIVIEVGPGTKLSNFSELTGKSLADEIVIAVEADPNSIKLARSTGFEGNWLFRCLKFENYCILNVIYRFAFPYSSGLRAALSVNGVPRNIERQMVLNGDAIIDLILAGAGEKEFLEYGLRVGERFGVTDFNSLRELLIHYRRTRSPKYMEFKKQLMDGLPEYFEKYGFTVVNATYLSPQQIKNIGTSWAHRCMKTNDLTMYLVVR